MKVGPSIEILLPASDCTEVHQSPDLMESFDSTEDQYRFAALHYETLIGDKAGRESVRVNNQYRIESCSETLGTERLITICNILELSNHYKHYK